MTIDPATAVLLAPALRVALIFCLAWLALRVVGRAAPHFAVLRVEELGESSVKLKVLATTAPLEQWNVAGELRRRIKATFEREGIEIPGPYRVVVSPDLPGGAARPDDHEPRHRTP